VSVRQAGPLVPLGTGHLLDEGASSPVNAFPPGERFPKPGLEAVTHGNKLIMHHLKRCK
jgi:hypothetical protein